MGPNQCLDEQWLHTWKVVYHEHMITCKALYNETIQLGLNIKEEEVRLGIEPRPTERRRSSACTTSRPNLFLQTEMLEGRYSFQYQHRYSRLQSVSMYYKNKQT